MGKLSIFTECVHCISGEKKKQRKETIAGKRRDRMMSRGVDLQKINLVPN